MLKGRPPKMYIILYMRWKRIEKLHKDQTCLFATEEVFVVSKSCKRSMNKSFTTCRLIGGQLKLWTLK